MTYYGAEKVVQSVSGIEPESAPLFGVADCRLTRRASGGAVRRHARLEGRLRAVLISGAPPPEKL